MQWIYLAVAGNVAVAIATVIDKYLLSARSMRPLAYAFGMTLLSVTAVVLIPFGVSTPPNELIIPIIGTGVANFIGIIFFFRAVRKSDVSLAAAKVGTFVVLSTYVFSRLLGTTSNFQLNVTAILLLTAGMFLLGILGRSIFVWTALSGILLGLSLTMFDIVLKSFGFVNGVFWTRIALFSTGILVFMVPVWGSSIMKSWRSAPRYTAKGIILSKAVVGIGLLLIYYAIQLGDVVTVSALQGIRFALVLGFALVLQRWLPHSGERTTPHILIGKIIGISLIIGGFFTLIL